MREITEKMINYYKINKLGYDFMGYEFNKKLASFHHLIVTHRECKAKGLGEGYLWWNGSILIQSTSHDYLHLIEAKDYDMFLAIKSEMINKNITGYLNKKNILRIRDILKQFEKEHCSDRDKKGKLLIKDSYIRGRKIY